MSTPRYTGVVNFRPRSESLRVVWTPLRWLPSLAACVCLALAAPACDGGGDDEDSESSDSGSVPDPDCDALLTPADFEAVCGAAITLEPTGFEGIELNPCNRDSENNEAILLVARHSNASQAASAADVAGGRGPTEQAGLGLWASAGSASVFSVEVKATNEAGAICAPEDLPTLLDLVLSRVAP